MAIYRFTEDPKPTAVEFPKQFVKGDVVELTGASETRWSGRGCVERVPDNTPVTKDATGKAVEPKTTKKDATGKAADSKEKS